jgi:hypothetical protein
MWYGVDPWDYAAHIVICAAFVVSAVLWNLL